MVPTYRSRIYGIWKVKVYGLISAQKLRHNNNFTFCAVYTYILIPQIKTMKEIRTLIRPNNTVLLNNKTRKDFLKSVYI